MGLSPIFDLSKLCVLHYQRLCESLRDITSEDADQIGLKRNETLTTMQDARSRFKAWANNIAALQDSRLQSSLDFRLRVREATEVRQRILNVLANLEENLRDSLSIVTCVTPNDSWGKLSDSEEEQNDDGSTDVTVETTELDQLVTSIRTANSTLMKLSIVIRNSPVRDDYIKAASRYIFDPRYDIGHVKEKHWTEKGDNIWLLERLGKAITRRRAFLKYREEHHKKLTRYWEPIADENEAPLESTEAALTGPEVTIAPTQHIKATTYIESKLVVEEDGVDLAGPGSLGTQTSYEPTTVGEEIESRLTVPAPPKWAFEEIPFEYGQPFQCPICYTEQNVRNKAEWKNHVFRDLKPYVCTFQGCSMRMFKSRTEWFAHEIQAHRREYSCQKCPMIFSERNAFAEHLSSLHSVRKGGSELEATILQCEEPVDKISASACLLCDDWSKMLRNPDRNSQRFFLSSGYQPEPYGTLVQFRRHLGRHMEQLALFALHRAEGDNMEDKSTDSLSGLESDGPESSIPIALPKPSMCHLCNLNGYKCDILQGSCEQCERAGIRCVYFDYATMKEVPRDQGFDPNPNDYDVDTLHEAANGPLFLSHSWPSLEATLVSGGVNVTARSVKEWMISFHIMRRIYSTKQKT